MYAYACLGVLALGGCAKTNRPMPIESAMPPGEGGADAEPGGSGTSAGAAGAAQGAGAGASHADASAGDDRFRNPQPGGAGTASECDPWYRCSCGPPLLRGGSRTFGDCEGECSFELTFYPEITLDVGCTSMMAELIVHDAGGTTLRLQAALTELGWEQHAAISGGFSRSPYLFTAPECPECAGGAVSSLWLLRATAGDPDRLEYVDGSPPELLREADAFVQAVIDQMRVCDGPFVRECYATVFSGSPDLPAEAQCELQFGDAPPWELVTCSVPTESAAPCRDVAACLCAADVLSPGHLEQESCTSAWLTPRGAPTFADHCVPIGTSTSLPLREAIMNLARAQGLSLATGSPCAAMQALY